MTPRQEAEKIIEMFKPYVYCYMGSGMLSNTYDEDVVRMNAIQCAIKHIEGIRDAILEATEGLCSYPPTWFKWNDILNELKQM